MPMIYCGLAQSEGRNPLLGHGEMLNDWSDKYDENFSNALTDTYRSEFFFKTFTEEQANYWLGLRHDSGDPITFGENAIAMYEHYGIEPMSKTIVFSDGLDITTIIKLADYFKDKINVVFGWGTNLMNDLGIRSNNIVMKAVRVNGIPLVKLSDDQGKEMGPAETIEIYARGAEEFALAA
jgi:nicotinate phosphoribosyltransferase